MEDLVNDEGLDLEALQAQIDLSLAQTQNLVATWLKPSKSASAGSSRINQEKDIQELLKRPPRLGVGAPIPASTGTLGYETMKLKGKLVSKKRTREVEDIGTETADQSDDEEESRAGAIKKKARVDPFAAKGKKKQAGNNSGQSALPTKSKPSPPHTPPRATSPSAEAQADATVVEPPNNPADEVSTGSPSKKTKKKKKHKDGNKEDKEAEDTVIGQERGATTSPTKVVTKPLSTADQHRDSTPPRGGFHKTEDPETPRVSTSTPQTTQAKETATPKLTGEASGLPLLNLEGPPSTLPLEASPAKKKRKRNRKKKKKQSEGGGQAHQSADHDAEPQDEEEEDE